MNNTRLGDLMQDRYMTWEHRPQKLGSRKDTKKDCPQTRESPDMMVETPETRGTTFKVVMMQ